ncbi:MAG: SDR family NAD(P)-dependent oxidoreductase [Beijerinckiaceae bacterium]|nr:SDR family NAD(P)-dependent oxidoreductase [Beijerinckiaceae bacterium]
MPAYNMGLAIISGGSSGIGKACAERLLERGHHVALLARDPERLEQTRAELSAKWPRAGISCHSVDVGDWEACQSTVSALVQVHGAPAWLIASAGTARPGLFLDQPAEEHARHIQVNFLGTVHLARAAAPAMAKTGGGRIVLIASGAAFLGIYGYSAYAPSKFAVRGLADILRLELAEHGISVTLACPPDTDTPQLAEEELTKPAVTRRISSAGGVWSADAVAFAIIAAATRRRFRVGPGRMIGALTYFHSIIAPIFHLRQRRLLRHEAGKQKVERQAGDRTYS